MSLLTLDRVSMRRGSDHCRDCAALHDISLDVDPGELVTVAAGRCAGRTALLRIAAGVARPTAGTARFGGVDLTRRPMLGRPNGIAYAMTHFESIVGGSVLEQVAAPLLGRGFSILRARTVAHRFLRRADVADCASLSAAELDGFETLRVAIARALVTAPALLLVDQPSTGDPRLEADRELPKLLGSIAHHDAIAVVLTIDEGCRLDGADRALDLWHGTLWSVRLSDD